VCDKCTITMVADQEDETIVPLLEFIETWEDVRASGETSAISLSLSHTFSLSFSRSLCPAFNRHDRGCQRELRACSALEQAARNRAWTILAPQSIRSQSAVVQLQLLSLSLLYQLCGALSSESDLMLIRARLRATPRKSWIDPIRNSACHSCWVGSLFATSNV
jgi:hypothetical protein